MATYSIGGESDKVLGHSRRLVRNKSKVKECVHHTLILMHVHMHSSIRDKLTSFAAWRNHSLADSALVMVSWVVNVCAKIMVIQ